MRVIGKSFALFNGFAAACTPRVWCLLKGRVNRGRCAMSGPRYLLHNGPCMMSRCSRHASAGIRGAIQGHCKAPEALSRFDRLASRGDSLTEKQQDQMEVLAVLIENYENEYQAVARPTPLEAIKFRMEQIG